ncbi:MAG: hypothetical protein JRL30_17125, partial [Deltaproteobacteria bacterium]|nr:hypothetical protein [Deltaproteobacteria bacterium]
MKQIQLILCVTIILLTGSSAHAAFPTHMNALTNDVDSMTGNWDDFDWSWRGDDDQDVSITFSNSAGWLPIGSYNFGARMAQSDTIYVDLLPADFTKSGSNITFSLSRTNVPPDGEYKFEVRSWEGATTNLARSMAQGMVWVSDSLYPNTNLYPFPQGITNMSDYLTITQAVTVYAQLDGDFAQFTGLLGTNHMIWSGNGTGGGRWTNDYLGTWHGYAYGDFATGTPLYVESLFTNWVSTNAYVQSN